MSIKEGCINLDTKSGKELGFTSDKFDGYLWRKGKFIWISFIISKQPNQKHFSQLLANIWAKGFLVKVPTPLAMMLPILRHKGFKKTSELFKEIGEVWVK